MGLFLTLLFILTAYLGPETLFGPIAQYHIETIIAALALGSSLLSMKSPGTFRMPQSFALVGMCFAVLLSFIFNGLGGLAITGMLAFLPNAFTYYLVVMNFRKKKHLQMVTLVLLAASTFTIYMGYTALQAGNLLSPYLVGQGNDEGEHISRLRGLAFINDPNDFAQLMVSLIPLLFLFWKKGKTFRNVVLVLPLVVLLMFGLYLTHSRGAIIAFIAICIFAFRRKIGTIPSLVVAGALFAGFTAVGWSGGREVSVEAGAGRMEAWAVGLDLIKQHPIFGVGFDRFAEYNMITAHNTVVVCCAELGTIGLFFWVMFILPTIRDTIAGSALPKKIKEPDQMEIQLARAAEARATASTSLRATQASLTAEPTRTGVLDPPELPAARRAPAHLRNEEESIPSDELLPKEEIQHIMRLQMLSLIGFLVAGWFLSRAYTMTLFIYGGMVQVIYRMALNEGFVPPRLEMPRLIRLSAISVVGLIFLVYMMLRVQHLLPG
jgi:O-antigen ligase